jgi:uncharacterized protein (DUF2236 family)
VDLRASIVAQIEAAGGRHDEAEIYDGPAGDPGIAGGPGSISWEINGDLASLIVGGTAAIIMEVLHPSVMAGSSRNRRTVPSRCGGRAARSATCCGRPSAARRRRTT